MKLRYVLILVLLVGVLIIATIFFIPKLTNENTKTTEGTNSTTETQPSEPIKNNQPDVTATTPITVPDDMQTVINNNTETIFVDSTNQLATAYPTKLIPLYGVQTVSSSNQITTDSGNPGWTTAYVSDLTTDDILTFYRSLLSSSENFTEEAISSSTNLKATVSGYNISITVSPNNPEKTDLAGNSAIGIFIEQV
ncbi:hypothetical protein [Acetobacterium woodii]|uniref:Uncharacterized protein n=1 Tax=Acetobacterium woodii (strain ATCC 29683 / DSM 1030 / JCM 2381 / KCTC 1655 / WB1) TaxID=931626 RepID=H6LB92_ACEWD|nr:hypothetical protein [Acetobacterium woodii]AFA47644.1 hypothetical protein Awo_c08530 [Acetobacterium woodii DSM 1030]